MINSVLLVGLVLFSLTGLTGNDCNEQELKYLSQKAEVVAVGRIVEIEPPLGLWSGYPPVGQHVKYQIEEVIKGKLPEREIYVPTAL